MRYFILILLLLNFIAIHNVLARKSVDGDDDKTIVRRISKRLKPSEDNKLQQTQRSDLSSKNTKLDKADLNTDKRRSAKKKIDDEKESNRRVFNTREERRPEPKGRPNIRHETNKYNKQEERRAPKVTDTRRQKEVRSPQGRQSNVRQGGRKATKHIPDDTDEDEDDTDEDDDDTDEDDDDDDDETDEDDDDDDDDTDEDDDNTDEDDDDDDNTDEDDDDTDEDDDDDDDTDEDDESFEMIAYKDKKKPTFLQRLKGKQSEKPKKQLSYRKKVYRELGLVDDDKNISSEEIVVRPKKYSKRKWECDSAEDDCP